MNAIFKKLQFKNQERICVLNAPNSFNEALKEMDGLTQIDQKFYKSQPYPFLLFFAENSKELIQYTNKAKPWLEQMDDTLFWVAYPKKSSKKYSSDINRDSEEWKVLGKFGFEGVRQIAIDEDWSALRFRKVDFIKTLKRNPKMILSEKGKKRVQ